MALSDLNFRFKQINIQLFLFTSRSKLVGQTIPHPPCTPYIPFELCNIHKWMLSQRCQCYKEIVLSYLNIYRSLIADDYGLIEGDRFISHRLSSIDYHVLNNMPMTRPVSTTFEFKNEYDEEVQVLLFYGKEIENSTDYLNKVPYYTSLLQAKEKTKLPRLSKEIYLYTIDKYGNRIAKEIIKN